MVVPKSGKVWKECGKCGKSVEYFPKKLWKSVVEWGIGTGCRDMIEKLSYSKDGL